MIVIKFDYRYIMIHPRDGYVVHSHFFYETDEQAIKDIPLLEKDSGFTVLEIGKSLNDAECKEGNDYYKCIWYKDENDYDK